MLILRLETPVDGDAIVIQTELNIWNLKCFLYVSNPWLKKVVVSNDGSHSISYVEEGGECVSVESANCVEIAVG